MVWWRNTIDSERISQVPCPDRTKEICVDCPEELQKWKKERETLKMWIRFGENFEWKNYDMKEIQIEESKKICNPKIDDFVPQTLIIFQIFLNGVPLNCTELQRCWELTFIIGQLIELRVFWNRRKIILNSLKACDRKNLLTTYVSVKLKSKGWGADSEWIGCIFR
ncbi:MAG: hypothetical protein Ta2E_10200 [Mycoplasmoidaceae bacterium]|nr:MAG: hypothetical protein Ta2E_10200 [Mycoplasmoidaceae bacterium]